MAEQDGEGEERLLFVVFSQERKDKEILQEDHEIKVHVHRYQIPHDQCVHKE